jgi:protein involved in polysaccharide export with SLBB domain
LILLAVAAVLCGGPANGWAADAAKTAMGLPAVKATSQDAAASYQLDNYKLRPTDIITISVVDDANATHDYSINVDGTVQLVYLDTTAAIRLAGLTIADAKKVVTKAYVDNKIFIKPSIAIDVKQYSSRKILVSGQVGKPGPVYIPAQKDMTLVAAVMEAGGPTEKAAATCNITRIMPDGSTKVLENVDLYGAVKDAKKDIQLQEGDTIFLGESAFANVWQH